MQKAPLFASLPFLVSLVHIIVLRVTLVVLKVGKWGCLDTDIKRPTLMVAEWYPHKWHLPADLAGFNHAKYPWIEWDEASKSGKFLHIPAREDIPENIKEQLIVELYSK